MLKKLYQKKFTARDLANSCNLLEQFLKVKQLYQDTKYRPILDTTYMQNAQLLLDNYIKIYLLQLVASTKASNFLLALETYKHVITNILKLEINSKYP